MGDTHLIIYSSLVTVLSRSETWQIQSLEHWPWGKYTCLSITEHHVHTHSQAYLDQPVDEHVFFWTDGGNWMTWKRKQRDHVKLITDSELKEKDLRIKSQIVLKYNAGEKMILSLKIYDRWYGATWILFQIFYCLWSQKGTNLWLDLSGTLLQKRFATKCFLVGKDFK